MDVFSSLIRFKVNKGDRIRFWLDVWCARDPLYILFLSCFNLARSKFGMVLEHMIRSRMLCSWDLKPRKNLNNWEIEEMGWLLGILDPVQVGDPKSEDEMIWTRDEEGGFSVKTTYEELCHQKLECLPGICA